MSRSDSKRRREVLSNHLLIEHLLRSDDRYDFLFRFSRECGVISSKHPSQHLIPFLLANIRKFSEAFCLGAAGLNCQS